MKKLLTLVAIAEGATGVALMVVPSLVGRLLFGAELTGVTAVVGRVAGIALFALGIACWLVRTTRQAAPREDWSLPCCFTTSPSPLSSLTPVSGWDFTAWRCGRPSFFTE